MKILLDIDLVEVTPDNLGNVLRSAISVQRLLDLIDEMVGMLLSKNADYGDAWQRYGVFTPLIRMNDKLLRVEKLSSGADALVAEEKIEDTLRDLIGYSALALLWMEHFDVQGTHNIESTIQQLAFEELVNAFKIPATELEDLLASNDIIVNKDDICEHSICYMDKANRCLRCVFCDEIVSIIAP